MKFFQLDQLSHRSILVILSFVSYVFLMFGNGIISSTHPDEVFYMQSAKEMVHHKDWLVPYIFDKPHFEKPILFFWLLAVSYHFFGTDPFWARFWPAAFGMLGVLVIYWQSWMLFRDKIIAFLAGLIACTSFIYIALSRAVLTDMVFSVWIWLTISCFYWAYTDPGRKNLGMILGFGFMGLAVLTKGLLGFCFPIMIIGAYLILQKQWKFLRSRSLLWGLMVFFFIVIPWHVYMLKIYGSEFIQEYFFNVHVRRLFEAEHPMSNTWYFYASTLISGVIPWSFFIFPAIYFMFRRIKEKSPQENSALFLLCWLLGVLIFVQPAHSKLASYVFPAYPIIPIILAWYLREISNPLKSISKKSFYYVGYLFAGFLILTASAGIYFAKKNIEYVVNIGPVYIFSLCTVCCAVVLFIFLRKKRDLFVVFPICGITATVLLMAFLGRQYAEPWISCKMISEKLNELDRSNSALLASKFYARGVRFYTDRNTAVIDIIGKDFFSPHPIPFLTDDDKVLNFLAKQAVTYGIVKRSSLDDLKRIVTKGSYRLSEFDSIGGKYIVKIERAAPNF